MNLPQYRYFQNVIGREEELNEIVEDAMIGEELVERGGKKQRAEGYLLLGKTKQRLANFLYSREDDIVGCKKKLQTQNIRQLTARMRRHLDILMVLPFFQGKTEERKRYVRNPEQIPGEKLAQNYRLDPKTKEYYSPGFSVPKLLLVNAKLYREQGGQMFTEQMKDELERLLTEDVHHIICVQDEGHEEVAYMAVKREDGCYIHELDHKSGTRKVPFSALLGEKNDMTAVALSLKEYLLEMEQMEKMRRKYREEHPRQSKHASKEVVVPRFEDKNAIKVFDITDRSAGEFAGGCFYFGRKGTGGHGAAGYERMPHTRKGHYRTYKNGKRVYVSSSII